MSVCVCVILYQVQVDVPVVVFSGCAVIDIVELAPYLDIWKTVHLPIERAEG